MKTRQQNKKRRVAWVGLLDAVAFVSGRWYRGSYSGWGEYRWHGCEKPKLSEFRGKRRKTGRDLLDYHRVPRGFSAADLVELGQ